MEGPEGVEFDDELPPQPEAAMSNANANGRPIVFIAAENAKLLPSADRQKSPHRGTSVASHCSRERRAT